LLISKQKLICSDNNTVSLLFLAQALVVSTRLYSVSMG